MRVPLYALLLLGWLPVSAFAETSCSLGDARRRVGVVTTAGGDSVPCAVRYLKEPEGREDPPSKALSALPVAEIEEPPPLLDTRPATLRQRLAADPRLRFYRSSFGEEALRDALLIASVDLNDDGHEELFLKVDLPELCRKEPCTWDLFQLGPEGGLATLGVRQIIEWRTLPKRREGFPDLAVRFPTRAAAEEAEYGLFHFAFGMYRRVGDAAPSDLFGSDAARWVPADPAADGVAP